MTSESRSNQQLLFIFVYLYLLDNLAQMVRYFAHSNHVTFSKQGGTFIYHTTMYRDPINFLYNPGHMTL